ncbi:hypothetical protein TOPH_09038 [Tolypocladium ophioglossoides CBS 100239]|uniref:Uncharacterized protein n=1 Tax=Tolypocladium ophioglossoides (strain CBS 100239) TaxID=1163406 RepID=A0A0L0MWM8_TOLOC|nr:hypothetical protein TOPH_09038 [Tolypocladium ophioglossoides CBS 100239]
MSGSSLYFGSPEPRAQTKSRAWMHGTPPHTTHESEHDSDPDSAVSSSPDVETSTQQASALANVASRYGNKSPYPFGPPGQESLVPRWSDDSDALSGEGTLSSCDSHEEYDDDWEEESTPHHGQSTCTPPTSFSNGRPTSCSNSPRSQKSGSASSNDQLSDWLMPRPAVQDFLARNPSVIRHLAYNTVGHLDWAFDDGGVDGAEVRVSGAAIDRNLLLYQAIVEVFWQSKRIWEVLDMAAEPTDGAEWTLRVWFRKRRRDTVPLASFTRMLDENPDLVMEGHQRRALAKEIRRNRPDSLLKFSTGVAEIEDRDAQDTPVNSDSY